MFKIGDVVALKSGGPKMTVAKDPTGDPQTVECAWFTEHVPVLFQDRFACAAIQHIPETVPAEGPPLASE